MRAILGLIFLVLAFPAAAETLVRSCATKPATDGFNACPTSTFVRPADAQWLVVNRRGVTDNVWLKQSELLATDRVYACMVDTIVAGAPFGAGCVDAAGVKVRLPSQTDNWMASELLPGAPVTSAKSIRLLWDEPLVDLRQAPVTDATRAIGYQVHVREDSCSLTPPSSQCGKDPWTTLEAGNVLKYAVVTDTRKCVRVQAVGKEGPGGVSDELCLDPTVPRTAAGLPGAPRDVRVEP